MFGGNKAAILSDIDLPHDELIEMLDGIGLPVIWTLKELRANSKIFKKLSEILEPKKVTELSSDRDRKSFIKKSSKLFDVPKGAEDLLCSYISQDRDEALGQIEVFSNLCKTVSVDKALTCLFKAQTKDVVFKIVDSVVDGDITGALKLLNCAEDVEFIHITHLLTKKLLCLYFLACGAEKQASETWKMWPTLLWENKKKATHIGKARLRSMMEITSRPTNKFWVGSTYEKFVKLLYLLNFQK